MSAPSNSTARRPLGFWMCLALVVGNMIGSGIFLLPASLGPYGLNSIVGWLLTASGAVALAIVFARLAAAHPQAGGPYIYPRLAFGESIGFLTAWGYWVSVWVGNAAIATGTVAALAELIPAIESTRGAPALTSCAMIWVLTLINWRGVQFAGAFQLVTTVLKVLPLIAVVVLAGVLLLRQDASVMRFESQPFTMSAVTASATLTLWALLGLESATVPAESVVDPKRTIPLATLWGTVVTAIIYVVTCSAVLLLIPGSELAASNAPFADVVRLFWGDEAASLLALVAFISGFGALNGWILVQGEMPRVLARDGIFPRVFAHESRYRTPGASLFITSALVTMVVLMNYSASMVRVFTLVILVSTSAYLVMYLFCALAALKLAWRGDFGMQGRRLAAMLAVATIAALYSAWTLYGAGPQAFWFAMGLLALGVPVYFTMKWRQRHGAAPAASEVSG
jgi:APA family basic amino acid/polyamine antiporter